MNPNLLYHGTDARMIEMTDDERQRFFDCCNQVIDLLYPLFEPLLDKDSFEEKMKKGTWLKDNNILKQKYGKLLNEKVGPYTYENLREKLQMVGFKKSNNGLYQYQSIYLTSLKPRAMNYARRSYAGCELGLMAYQIARAAEVINFDNFYPDEIARTSIDFILEFGKEGNEQPVIVTIDEYDVDALTLENGNSIPEIFLNMWHKDKDFDLSLRYNSLIDLSKFKMEKLTDELYKKIRKEYPYYPV